MVSIVYRNKLHNYLHITFKRPIDYKFLGEMLFDQVPYTWIRRPQLESYGFQNFYSGFM